MYKWGGEGCKGAAATTKKAEAGVDDVDVRGCG